VGVPALVVVVVRPMLRGGLRCPRREEVPMRSRVRMAVDSTSVAMQYLCLAHGLDLTSCPRIGVAHESLDRLG
jgi:hypothetical protein